MAKKFTWINVDKTKLPKTKGKRINGFRFYDIDGKTIYEPYDPSWEVKTLNNEQIEERKKLTDHYMLHRSI